ncbi:hypothetical protein [Streptomyces sp. NPDC058653]|uniref:hypothetical protein n=1 Tax=Streptomyces sp. NPDC058653 TaxID=3346576 RepID=UPI0036614F99
MGEAGAGPDGLRAGRVAPGGERRVQVVDFEGPGSVALVAAALQWVGDNPGALGAGTLDQLEAGSRTGFRDHRAHGRLGARLLKEALDSDI